MSTFEAWPKIPRWNRNVVITEKIDGTNAAIIIEQQSFGESLRVKDGLNGDYLLAVVIPDDVEIDPADGLPMHEYHVYAQSRTRLIHPGADNQGFAQWVIERAPQLAALLGPGRHFGEFYGAKIGRKYGLDHKRFALFNTSRWNGLALQKESKGIAGLEVDVVPVLGIVSGPNTHTIEAILGDLDEFGSVLVPGFDRPEGIVLFHSAARQTFKVLLEGDELPKGVVPRHEREAA